MSTFLRGDPISAKGINAFGGAPRDSKSTGGAYIEKTIYLFATGVYVGGAWGGDRTYIFEL